MKKVVGAIIENQKGEFLLQKRTDDAPSYPGYWTLFGGIINMGESPKQAILRELKEELNLSDKYIMSIKKVQQNVKSDGVVQIIYHLVITATKDDLTLSEGAAMKFVSQAEIWKKKFAFNIKDVLIAFFKKE